MAGVAEDNPLTHYCLVRADLSPGLQAANLIHAAGESGPVPEHTHAVALHCRDEAHLREVWARLQGAGVKHTAILECDGEHAGELMALGCAPAPRKEVRKLLSSLPLVR